MSGLPTASTAENVPAPRVFLVVVDETEEMRNALRYACRRARHTIGRVMEEEARAQAEQRMQVLATEVFAQIGSMPVIHIREGQRADQLVALLQEDPTISLLVMATASGAGNPGPLVTFLLGHLGRRIRIPVTLVPGELSVEEIDALS